MIDQSQYEELLQRARKRFQRAEAFERDIRVEADLDLAYLCGDQWNAKVKRERERGPFPRPCLVFNKVLPPVTQLCNQGRQNKPAIQVSPVDSAGDPDTAKVMQGLIRHIEYDSDAEQAYDTALFYAAGCSFGYWRYGCKRIPKTFDQELETIPVDDPFSIYLDCDAKKLDRSDSKWGFCIDKMPDDAFEARFGKDPDDLDADFIGELAAEGWIDDDTRRVAEYWEVDTTPKTLRMRKAEDGSTHPEYLEDLQTLDEGADEPRPWTDEEIDATDWVLGEDGNPREETDEVPRVMCYIINGARVLETPTEWEGETIPIVKITGLEVTHRGKRKIFSMTRFARDPQQLLNFYKTMEAESIALAPKPKFVGAVGQFKTKRRDWQRANIDNAAYLEYDLVSVGDKIAPEPQWRPFDPPVQALAMGAAAAADDIKSSTGYFDPSLGKEKADQSGVAIGKLQRQGDVSNFHFVDNWGRGLKRGGRILLEMIPKKYDTEREIRIIGEDQKQRIVKVNAAFQDQDGKWKHHRLDVGKYDCRVAMGASYEGQRDQTREMIQALAQGAPEVWQLAADVFFENSDFIGAERLAKRFKAMLPPQVQQAEDSGQGQQDVPPQVQAQMSQQAAALQQLQAQNQQLLRLLGTKVLEMESKERQNTQTNLTRAYVAEVTSKSSLMNQQAQRDHDALQQDLDRRADILHDSVSLQAEMTGQQQDQQQAGQQQQADQQHEAAMQGADQQHTQQLQSLQQQHQQQLAALAQRHQAALQAMQHAHDRAMQPAEPEQAEPEEKQ